MPVTMPAYAFSAIDVNPELGKHVARSEGGLIITGQRSDPFWRGELATRELNMLPPDNEHADFLAWLISTADLNMRVDFVHPVHRVPSAYTVATWPMAGNGSLVNVPDLRTVQVQGLAIGLVLKRGDRLSIRQGDLVVHRWIAEPVTVSSAINQPLKLTPRLPIGVLAPGAAVVLKDPVMRFMIVPGSWSAREEARGDGVISFEVSESLR